MGYGNLIKNQKTKVEKRGGLRNPPGGRPKGSKEGIKSRVERAKVKAVENVVAEFQRTLEERLLKNLRNLGVLADGLTPEQAEAFGVLPDRYANIYLIDRLLGKPVERREDANPPPSPLDEKLRDMTTEALADFLVEIKMAIEIERRKRALTEG